MLKRTQQLTQHYSLFLFGARGTGKSTLIEQTFDLERCLYINLLNPLEEDRFAKDPQELVRLVKAMPKHHQHVIIDEVHKLPKLLDVVHLLIEAEKTDKFFVLTGSSARKLKTAGVNLLAGRAFVYHLFPFSFVELAEQFDLTETLKYGLLPGVFHFNSAQEKQHFLQAYALTYLKEEIWAEQIVKKLDPFRKFLTVAAQCNGKIINYLNIARDVGADDKTIKNYFSILEDTLLGFMLEPFQHSFRKRLRASPKFYFIDTGITRALSQMLSLPPKPGTSYYGELFENFIVTEILKLATTYQTEYRFSYLLTGSGVEVDLVVERPGQPLLLIEIKSTDHVNHTQLSTLESIVADIGECEAICLSQDPRPKTIGSVTVHPWAMGIRQYFAPESLD